jgi:hypothetical protein
LVAGVLELPAPSGCVHRSTSAAALMSSVETVKFVNRRGVGDSVRLVAMVMNTCEVIGSWLAA